MNYKEASKIRLRFSTNKGMLTIEQLWDLSLTELDSLAVFLEKAYKDSKGKSFLDKKSTKDKTIKLQFDIVLDILETKIKESEELRNIADNKAHNQKIDDIIAEKQDENLKDMSIKDLEKQRK